MSGSAERRRQKKIETSRQKREVLRKQARRQAERFTGAALVRRASTAPFGPCWISESLDDHATLATVIVSRRVAGQFVAHVLGVDRACLGVKHASVSPLISELDLEERAEDFTDAGDALRRCDPLFAQSVVFHALDYARSLGFSPDPDFEPSLIGPRPETLTDTPGAHPDKPFYISGPADNVARILLQLEESVGRGNYEFAIPTDELTDEATEDGEFDDAWEEDEDEGDADIDDELPENVAVKA